MPDTHLRLIGHAASLCGDRSDAYAYVPVFATCSACMAGMAANRLRRVSSPPSGATG